MLYVLILSVFAVTSILFWLLQLWTERGFTNYQSAFKKQAHKDLGDMFLFLDPAQVWLAGLFLCGTAAILIYIFTDSLIVAACAAGISLLFPSRALSHVRHRRQQRLEQQLPDMLLALAGALRAGSGIQSALRHTVDHAPAPLSQELGLMLRQQRMGVSFEQALHSVYRRVPTEGFSLVVSTLKIAGQSGGNLAETLERISVTLRTRQHLRGRVHALTSQGRMQAWVMASLPPGLAFVLYRLEPDAMSALWQTPAGWAVLLLVVVLESVGIFFIRRIVRIDV